MQVNFDSVAEIKAGEVNQFFQPDGVAFFTRRIAIIDKKGRVDHVVLFGDTEAALQLPGESAMIDPQDFPSQAAYDAACLPATEGTVDLAAEAAPVIWEDATCPRCLANNPNVPTGVNVTCAYCGENFMASEADFSTVDPDHPQGCSCGSPDCPQWQASQLGVAYGPD